MAHLPEEAHDLMVRQHGVISTAQFKELEIGRRRVEVLERRGDIVHVVRGAYRSRSVPDTELSKCAALSLARPDVAICGPTAGRLWGFRRVRFDQRIHLLTIPRSNPCDASWAVPCRTAAWDLGNDTVERHDGIRVTHRGRTALDLARSLDDDSLLSVIEQAMHDGGLRDGELRATALPWRHRRTWVRRFLAQLDRRLDGPAAESEPEIVVATKLDRVAVAGLVRQHPIELPGYGDARFDLAIPELRLAIEVDVFPTHRETVGRERDQRRDAAAIHLGWWVERVSAFEFDRRLDERVAEIVAVIATRRARVG